jgi:hypothetical protein
VGIRQIGKSHGEKIAHRGYQTKLQVVGSQEAVAHEGNHLVGRLLRGAADLYLYVQAGAKAIQNGHETIHREPPEVGVANAREVGRSDAGARMGFADAQIFLIQYLNDLRRQDRLELGDIRVLVTKIAEDVPASPLHFESLNLHCNISLSTFKRCRIVSISRCGVLMPCFDFF